MTQRAHYLDLDLTRMFVETLAILGCPRENAELFCRVRGLAGEPPVSLRKATDRLSGEGVRGVVHQVERKYLPQVLNEAPAGSLLRERLRALLSFVRAELPGTNDQIARACSLKGIMLKRPIGIFHWATLLGVEPEMRMDRWASFAKYSNPTVLPGCGEKTQAKDYIDALVEESAPDIFEGFIACARKSARLTFAISARYAAELYTAARGIAVSDHEAKAMLEPFAVELGRVDGEDWFVFLSLRSGFIERAAGTATALQVASFEGLSEGYRRSTRIEKCRDNLPPDEVLRRALTLFGFALDGDEVRLARQSKVSREHALSPIRLKMLSIVRKLEQSKRAVNGWVPRREIMAQARAEGLNDVTVAIYLTRSGLFAWSGAMYRVKTGASVTADDQAVVQDSNPRAAAA